MPVFSKEKYNSLIQDIFQRFPSVQTSPFGDAYKPGLDRMIKFENLLGNPDKCYCTIHVAGTNGKGSVANMLASVLAGAGLKVGLYTSPHILDFRERMRVISGKKVELVPEEYVFDFISDYSYIFDDLELSFFEITTGLSFKWFADVHVDVAVIEVGLGGRLDSTNIISPELSIVTSIGFDHCALLGDTLDKIAFEKAGIFKDGIPAIVGQTLPETEPVFLRHASETGSPIYFADREEPSMWHASELILKEMDLRGAYQKMNVRTVLMAVDILREIYPDLNLSEAAVIDSLIHTASRTEFHGRWERVSANPDVICDIGHNAAALVNNFAQLNTYLDDDTYSSLIIVYGVMADKDLNEILPLFPERVTWIFTTPDTRRALPAENILADYKKWCAENGRSTARLYVCDEVRSAVAMALRTASQYGGNPLIYIGGSTFVVSESLPCFMKNQ